MERKYLVPLAVFLLSQTSWPVSFTLSKYKLMGSQLSVFVAGVICLTLATVGPYVLFSRHFKRIDPLLMVWSLFSWTCMIDLGIGLELDGYISNFIGFYFAEGEPYLMTAHGTAINYWDGTFQFGLCIAIIAFYTYKKSHRELALVWVGSILNSMVVLLPGGVAGKHPFKLSILLNTPYLLCPVYAAFKLLHEHPPQARTFLKFKPLWKRPVDLLFAVYFVAASCVAIFSGLAVLGGNASAMKTYLNLYDPYLKDPSNFPKFQTLAYSYMFLAYYLYAIYGLVYPGTHRMTDWSLIHAGAAAQAQVTYIWGSCHHRTQKDLQSPVSGPEALLFWSIHLTLLVVPQLFALWCQKDFEKFGRSYTVARCELIEERLSTPVKAKQRKSD
ncbi:transmembrane 6 superfamily member 1 [Aplysia californica]|uniref:Transmembrane 6 superfamily member 1 n=1 Tax=Aplysia californica TaxID=6500 RepID=A0ABM0JEZ8_APLCA|nr:transmembrane 6 superfamily member 1 [Aplysia californica]